MRSNGVIRKSFLTLLLRVLNSWEERISSIKTLIKAKAKEKAINRRSAKITYLPGKRMTERKKICFLLNTTIVAR
jgi:hypothetical protein